MTIKECIRENGWHIEVVSLKKAQSVDITFINDKGEEDETQFDVERVCTEAGINELSVLFEQFCKENHFPVDHVLGVTIVRSANSLEDLS